MQCMCATGHVYPKNAALTPSALAWPLPLPFLPVPSVLRQIGEALIQENSNGPHTPWLDQTHGSGPGCKDTTAAGEGFCSFCSCCVGAKDKSQFVCCKGSECSGSSGKAAIGALYCVGGCPTTDVKTAEKFSDNLNVTLIANADAFTGEYIDIERSTGNSSVDPVTEDTSSGPRGVTNVLFTLTVSAAIYMYLPITSIFCSAPQGRSPYIGRDSCTIKSGSMYYATDRIILSNL